MNRAGFNLNILFNGSEFSSHEISQKRQSVNRRVGPPSSRGHNEVPESLLWAIKL